MSSKFLLRAVAALALFAASISLRAQTTAFTYQGQLAVNGSAGGGTFDFQFSVYDAVSNGTLIGGPITNLAVTVSNGLFTVAPDFGSAVFTGPNRWLAIGVRTNGSVGAFAGLTPRQALTPSPYALYAPNAGTVTGTLAVSNLPANVALLNGNQTFSGALQFTNPANAFSGNGAGLTNLGLGALNTGGAVTWTGVFRPGPTLSTGSGPAAVAAGDFNLDGQMDLVAVDDNDLTVIVYTNTGNGGFTPSTTNTLVSGANPFYVAVADVNGDGWPDIITANSGNNTLSILTNNRAGGFVLSTNLTGLSTPYFVTAADINGDQKPDLIAANYGNSTLSVFTNNGSGVFVLASSPGTGSQPVAVAVADVNGDGRPDLISANLGGNSLSIITNKGGGQFGTQVPVMVGTNPYDVVAADFNGDGRMDLACVNYTSDTVNILTNNGSGTFTISGGYNAGASPISLAVADFNGDGKPDLVWAADGANYLVVLTNGGSNTFGLASVPLVGANPHSVIAVDLNGDGRPDLVSAGSSVNMLSVLYNTPTYNVGTLNVWGGLTVNTNVIYVAVNGGSVGINNTSPIVALDVHGEVNATGGYEQVSDERYKTNVATLTDALEKILALRGVGFDWRRQDYPDMNFGDARQLGFIAQELANVLPEAVSRDAQGHYTVAYSEVIPVLVEALKEQKRQADAAQQEDAARISALEQRLGEMQKMVDAMAASNGVTMPKPRDQ